MTFLPVNSGLLSDDWATTSARIISCFLNPSLAVENSHPYEEHGQTVSAFGDDGDLVALKRPTLRSAPRKAPWRYWASMRIPQVTDGPSFEPYKEAANIFGKPFAMTADLEPKEKSELCFHLSELHALLS